MKFNKTIFFSLSLILLLSNSSFVQTKTSDFKSKEFRITLSIERGNTDEKIVTYLENDTLFADFSSRDYFSQMNQSDGLWFPEYYGVYGQKRIELSNAQIDSLAAFEEMLIQDSIRHNQGLKMAGRLGQYKLIHGDVTVYKESRNLFSLLTALGLEKK